VDKVPTTVRLSLSLSLCLCLSVSLSLSLSLCLYLCLCLCLWLSLSVCLCPPSLILSLSFSLSLQRSPSRGAVLVYSFGVVATIRLDPLLESSSEQEVAKSVREVSWIECSHISPRPRKVRKLRASCYRLAPHTFSSLFDESQLQGRGVLLIHKRKWSRSMMAAFN
jgi:hypothetical protein